MISRVDLRAALALLLATTVACPPSLALISLNDGRDRIFVTGSLSAGHDSNVYANNEGKGDVVYSSSVAAEYTRRAGWIGVNGSMSINAARFAEFTEEDYENPSFNLELTKQSGRTTGSVTLSAARESRADAAVNLRSTSWNYVYGANFKYPIAGAYTLTGNFGYSGRKYIEDTILADLDTYTAALDVIRILTSDRELMAGYRYRYGETSRDTSTTDHSFSLGLNGRLLRGVSGSLRVGYQTRIPDGPLVGNNGNFDSWSASASTSYAINKKLNLSGSLSKDFSTTAADSSVDVLAASLDAQYAFNSRWSMMHGIGWGHSQFLGDAGRIVIATSPALLLGPQREDTYLSWNSSINYSLNEHLKVSASYSWFHNWSTLEYADFVRSSWTLNLSSRW